MRNIRVLVNWSPGSSLGEVFTYSRTLVACTLMTRLPQLFRTFLSPLKKNHIAADLR